MINLSPELSAILMIIGMMVGLYFGQPVAFVMGGVATIMSILGWGPAGLYLFMNRSFDTITNNIMIAIPLFILMASFLEKSGMADELFEAMMHVFGSLNGGIALAVVVLSVIFAATTGIMGATVVSMSVMAIPMMMKREYDKCLATGCVAAGGSLGILIPPSIMLVMMADQSGISVGRLFAGAFLPGALLGVLFFVYVLIVTAIDPSKGKALTEEERKAIPRPVLIKKLLKSLVPPLLLILAVLGSIWMGVATPTEAAGVGALIALLLMIAYKRFTWKALLEALYSTFKSNCMVLATMIGATLFTGVFLGLGGGDVVTNLVMSFAGLGRWGIFFIMMLIVFLLGFMVDWIGIIYMTFPIFLPIAESLGFDLLWFVIMMAVNLQMSFLTPPFGYALFYLKGTVPPSINLGHIYRGAVPFVALQMLGLVILCFAPIIVMYIPNLLF
ncbi:MAG: TRAP transporter large permease [Tepidanaerobacteraceae bacterium]|jgi:tripartite ATP-independent transporter DctM subunit